MNDTTLDILVIEDDLDQQANLCDILELDGYHVVRVGDLRLAKQLPGWDRFAAVILDRKLPDGNAEDALPWIKQKNREAAVLIVTGYADMDNVIAALRLGASDYILKPINPEILRARLQRVAHERQLRFAKLQSEAAFRTLVEVAPSTIVILDELGKILYFNTFAEKLTGYRSAEMSGKSFFDLFVPDEPSRLLIEPKLLTVCSRSPVGFEAAMTCKDGARRWLVWNSQCLPQYEGKRAILTVGQDITDVKEAQNRALQSERLAAIGQMVTGLAHESRNALQRSQACLEMLLLEVEDRPAARDLVARIQKAQDHLHQLYEEVRTYAAPIHLEREEWNLAGIWRQAWTNLAGAREGKDAQLRENVNGTDLRIQGDHFRLEQVFRNIFDNSLGAGTPPVEIQLQCSETILNGGPALHIRICDNGPGLNAEQRRRIFDPFFTTKTRGTGLGMAIARRIVEAHGGRIEVGPPTERGAELILSLPRGDR